jgi:inhibitor of cysteine peptidase
MRRSFSGAIAIVVVLATVGGAIAIDPFPVRPPSTDPAPESIAPGDPGDGVVDGSAGLVQFESAAEFEEYVRESHSGRRLYLRGGADAGGGEFDDSAQAVTETPAAESDGGDGGSPDAGATDARVSETNVQEVGIDEPDILKARGSTVFYAGSKRSGPDGTTGVRILNASDPPAPTPVGEIDEQGRMLIAGNDIVILGHDEIHGYDISAPEDPQKQWERDLDARIKAARLLNGSIYLVLREDVTLDDPCPIEPMSGVAQDCTDVYRPRRQTNAEATYTTVSIDPGDGDVKDAVSVVGSHQYTATYVSQNGVYLTYATSASRANLTIDFLLQQETLLDDRALDRLETLESYDLSEGARMTELRAILQDWLARVEEDDREAVRETLEDRRAAYFEEHKRDVVETGVVRIDVAEGDLAVGAVGSVPGRPLNQFSMDEYEGRLRIATTVPGFGAESENDLYVLDGDLSPVGAVQGMGLDERIYSVRFMNEEAYVVTFRRIDPFHVVDLSNPADPTVQGELKLPGFSSYLHPVAEDRVLGIGQEDGQVKAVLFDVSTPTDPTIADSTILEDRWSAISRTHHAFLQDRKHGVVFIPGREGGNVFEYEEGLDRVATIDTQAPAQRAMYIGDYLYVFAGSEVVVVNETDWSRETTVDL